MTGLKIALYTLLTTGGFSTAFLAVMLSSTPVVARAAVDPATGTVLATADAPVVSGTTPVTMALAWGGMVLAATFGWKVSRAWSQMEGKLGLLEERLASIEDRCNRGTICVKNM